jgi:Asp-tRNA(Asn)/Glu-tRNA(Gln) amidotransferase A subunit family amidase
MRRRAGVADPACAIITVFERSTTTTEETSMRLLPKLPRPMALLLSLAAAGAAHAQPTNPPTASERDVCAGKASSERLVAAAIARARERAELNAFITLDATSKLPVGLELDGPAGSDRRLIAIGLALEPLFGRLPPPAK